MSKNFTLDLHSNSFKKSASTCSQKKHYGSSKSEPAETTLDFILSYAASKRFLKYKGKPEFHFTLN
jgi:hypothetical protein